MNRLQKILTGLYNAALNESGISAEEVMREELKAAFRAGWRAQREHCANSLQAEEAVFARTLDEEVD